MLPENPATPVIMVGPGAGLAPFRAFLQEKRFLEKSAKIEGEFSLYFGCRAKKVDYIYEKDLEKF